MAFDRDVNFMNDYRMLGLGDKPHLFQPTRTGYAESAWTIGPAIVWSPFFAAGHVVATRLHANGLDVATDGTSFPYRQAVCVASLFYGLLGCWFCLPLRAAVLSRAAGGARRLPHRLRLVHGVVPRERAEHDARVIHGVGRRLHVDVGGDTGERVRFGRGRSWACSRGSWG